MILGESFITLSAYIKYTVNCFKKKYKKGKCSTEYSVYKKESNSFLNRCRAMEKDPTDKNTWTKEDLFFLYHKKIKKI